MENVIIRHKKGKNALNIGNIGEIFCGADMWGRGEEMQDNKLTIGILLPEAKDIKKTNSFFSAVGILSKLNHQVW